MPPKKSAKKATTSKSAKANSAAATRQAKREAELAAMHDWIEANDPLLDKAATNPINLDDMLSTLVTRKTFAQPGVGQVAYDWSVFRAAVEARHAGSPRWYVQLREEDLLAGDDGMEGVTLNCFVVAEASEPTLAPAEYVVKVHWPYSDAEDNAPERILSIAGQDMCWRRVVKSDGSDANMYLLQKRSGSGGGSGSGSGGSASSAPAASFGFGAPSAAPAVASATPAGFGFGFAATTTTTTTTATTTTAPFGFGFGGGVPQQAPQTSAAAPISFGFGAPAAASATAAPAFGFGIAPAAGAAGAAAAPLTTTTATAAAPSSPNNNDDGSVKVQPLKPAEVLFCLWSKRRLTAMAHEVKSGSRIVREKFPLDASRTIKVVMENDRKDSVSTAVHSLILNRLFAKTNEEVREVDKWIGDCPVYDEHLTTAMQTFRAHHVEEIAAESDEFSELCEKYQNKLEAELQRIVDIRASAAQKELDAIDAILEKMRSHQLAEKSSFRLLKYYPKNDIQKFRPFGKVSGVSEMGETVDLCEPPAHVNINPFTGLPS